jgi:hypothetical protein
MLTHADPDTGQILLKFNFYMKNILLEGRVTGHKHTYLRKYKSLFERLEIRFISKLCSTSLLLDPDPDPQNQMYGSRRAKSMQIHNTASKLYIFGGD